MTNGSFAGAKNLSADSWRPPTASSARYALNTFSWYISARSDGKPKIWILRAWSLLSATRAPLLKYPVMFPQPFFFPSSFCQNWQWSPPTLYTCKKYIRKTRMTTNWKSIRYHSGNLVRSKLFSWIEGEVHPIPFDVFLHLNVKIVKAIFRELWTTSARSPDCTDFLSQVLLGYDPLEDRITQGDYVRPPRRKERQKMGDPRREFPRHREKPSFKPESHLACISSSHASNQPNPQPLVGKTLESILVLSEEL